MAICSCLTGIKSRRCSIAIISALNVKQAHYLPKIIEKHQPPIEDIIDNYDWNPNSENNHSQFLAILRFSLEWVQ